MRTSKAIILSFLIGIFIISSGAGCGSNDEPKPDNFQSLIGKWELFQIINNITKQNGTSTSGYNKFKANGNILTWEFFSDGRLVAEHDGQKVEGRWKLSVKALDGQRIDSGTLTVSGVAVKELMDTFGISEIVYGIFTENMTGGTPTLMNLQFDVTKYGPYQKHFILYDYRKI